MSIIRGTQKSDFDASIPLRRIVQEEAESTKEEKGVGGKNNEHERIEKRIEALKAGTQQDRKLSTAHYGSMKWAGIETQEDWQKLYDLSKEQYKSGEFFFNWIGRGRELEPDLVGTLIVLRDQWANEYAINTIPEWLLLDCALVSYYHFLRTNYIIGNLEADIEWNLFGSESPMAKVKKAAEDRYSSFYSDRKMEFKGYRAEDSLRAISDAQLPMLDTFNRMLIRNLKAIRDLKRGNIQLNIGNVGQMNIGEKQINVDTNNAA